MTNISATKQIIGLWGCENYKVPQYSGTPVPSVQRVVLGFDSLGGRKKSFVDTYKKV